MFRRCLETRSWLVISLAVSLGPLGCETRTEPPKLSSNSSTTGAAKSIVTAEDEELLKKLCTQCHLFTDPGTLMKKDWEEVGPRMARMPGYGRTIPRRLELPAVVQWFRERAPDNLAFADRSSLPIEPPPLRRVAVVPPQSGEVPFIAQLKWLNRSSSANRRFLSCDMRTGWIWELRLDADVPTTRIVDDQIPNSVRLEEVDLDADGQTELLVANLGSFAAMDHNLGTVEWLRPQGNGWERVTLAENLGRVADVKSFDHDGDGDLDIAVAEFGWRQTGHVLLLENETPKTERSRKPKFTPKTLDERHGAVQLEIVDLDHNGRNDVIALLAQEHEMLVAYLNQPDGTYKARELFRAPHPTWGYSGFQLLDFDGDEDLDVLLTNGDMFDGATIKPYHCIAWLENRGDLKFEHHVLAELPGVHRAEAADLDGDGDLDIVACAFVPEGTEEQAAIQKGTVPPSLVWLEQTAPQEFRFHVWERGPGRYPTLTTGDFDGDGKTDVALGVGMIKKLKQSDAPSDYFVLWLSSQR